MISHPGLAPYQHYLAKWAHSRLDADEYVETTEDSYVRYFLPQSSAVLLKPTLTPAIEPMTGVIHQRAVEFRWVRGLGYSIDQAVSGFQYYWDMHLQMPWRVKRVWWRLRPTVESQVDFATNRVHFLATARLAFEPIEEA